MYLITIYVRGVGVGQGAGPNLDTYNIEMELLVCVKR